MTDQIEDLVPTEEVVATGNITDGVITIEGKLPHATFVAEYLNVEEGHRAVDTLYQSWPSIMSAVLEQIAIASEEAEETI